MKMIPWMVIDVERLLKRIVMVLCPYDKVIDNIKKQFADWHYLYRFALLYILNYMASTIFATFMPVYLDQFSFSRTATGTLLSLSPLIAIAAQPVWGMAGDRARSKNTVLKLLIGGSALAMMLYPLSGNYYYLFAAMAFYSFFQTPIMPIADAITLEHLEGTRWKYGPIRMAGTIGFAVMSIIAGRLLKSSIGNMFILYFVVSLSVFAVASSLPPVKGHQSQGRRVAVRELFKNRELLLLMAFYMVTQITMGFYYSFFPIYFRQLGADNFLLGCALFTSSISEIPFLLNAPRITDRLGIRRLLLISGAVIAVRWLLMYLVTDVFVILPIMLMHGMSFIVFSYSIATYISREVPRELRATGQTLSWLFAVSLARAAGSIAGGFLADIYGIRLVFLFDSYLAFAAVAVFGSIFLLKRSNSAVDKKCNGVT